MSDIIDTYDPIEAYPDTQFPIKVVDNPTIVTYPSGDTYAVSSSTRLRVPTGTTREDLSKWMVWERVESTIETKRIPGSKGNTYTVQRNAQSGTTTCTCPGFRHRGKCKHLKLAFPS